MKSILPTPQNQPQAGENNEEMFDADAYLAKKETDENLKKLASAMAAEWTLPENAQPDLSFARFEEFVRNRD